MNITNSQENNFENLFYNFCETNLEMKNTYETLNKFFKDFISLNDKFNSEKILELTDQIEDTKENIKISKNNFYKLESIQILKDIEAKIAKRKSFILSQQNFVKSFMSVSCNLVKNKNKYKENVEMHKAEQRSYEYSLMNNTQKVEKLKISILSVEEKIYKTKTEYKTLKDKEYELMNSIISMEKQLLESSNLKNENMTALKKLENELSLELQFKKDKKNIFEKYIRLANKNTNYSSVHKHSIEADLNSKHSYLRDLINYFTHCRSVLSDNEIAEIFNSSAYFTDSQIISINRLYDHLKSSSLDHEVKETVNKISGINILKELPILSSNNIMNILFTKDFYDQLDHLNKKLLESYNTNFLAKDHLEKENFLLKAEIKEFNLKLVAKMKNKREKNLIRKSFNELKSLIIIAKQLKTQKSVLFKFEKSNRESIDPPAKKNNEARQKSKPKNEKKVVKFLLNEETEEKRKPKEKEKLKEKENPESNENESNKIYSTNRTTLAPSFPSNVVPFISNNSGINYSFLNNITSNIGNGTKYNLKTNLGNLEESLNKSNKPLDNKESTDNIIDEISKNIMNVTDFPTFGRGKKRFMDK